MNKKQKDLRVSELLLELGNTYLEHGDYDKAIEKLSKLGEMEESNSEAYSALSKAYILKKQFDKKAQLAFEKTLKLMPDNLTISKVLSQIYLQTERLDEQALEIYQNVIEQDGKNSQNLFEKLLRLSLSQNKFEIAQNLIQLSAKGSDLFQQALQIFMIEAWKSERFDVVSQFLNGMLESEQDALYLQLFLLNLLKANKVNTPDFKLTDDDLKICVDHIHSADKIGSLVDIYLFLAINRLLKKFPAKQKSKATKKIEEFELFLGDNAFSNIWDQGINKQVSTAKDAGVDYKKLWEKLNIWHPEIKNETDKINPEVVNQENITKILDNANCLMLIKMKTGNYQDIEQPLSESIQAHIKKDSKFVQGFTTSDGRLIFWENVDTLVKAAIDFTNKLSSKNNSDAIKFQADIVIHTISLTQNRDFNYLFDDLEIALTIFEPEKQLVSQNKNDESASNNNQFFITSAVKNLIEKANTLLFMPSELIAEHPVSHEKFLVHKMCGDDTLIKIKTGDLKNIGRYNLIKELHQGEIFISYKAIDTNLERPVIIKILKLEFIQANSRFKIEDLFLKNGRLLGKYNHPDIALIYDVGKEQNLCYIAREYVEGEYLKVPKKLNRKINWQWAVELCINVADVLTFSHENNIIHGRLKPNNIFVINKNGVKLTDFQINDISLPVQQIENGSLNYLTYYAPERIKDKKNNPKFDIYSLGVILYELLTDFNPFLFEEKQKIIDQVLNKMPEPITKHNSKLPDELNTIVFKAIEKDPKKRFESMQEFGGELKKIIEKT